MLLESLHRREGILARVSSCIDFPEYPEDLENKVETLEDPNKTRCRNVISNNLCLFLEVGGQ